METDTEYNNLLVPSIIASLKYKKFIFGVQIFK